LERVESPLRHVCRTAAARKLHVGGTFQGGQIKHGIIASRPHFPETKNPFRGSFLAEPFPRLFLGWIIQKHTRNQMKKFYRTCAARKLNKDLQKTKC